MEISSLQEEKTNKQNEKSAEEKALVQAKTKSQ